jgi:hypothetical protein
MAIREQETGALIEFLNGLLEVDRRAITRLVATRVLCGSALGEHPTVQVGVLKGVGLEVGMLGVLNGFCGVFDEGPKKGWGPIMAIYDGDQIARFRRTDEKAIDA